MAKVFVLVLCFLGLVVLPVWAQQPAQPVRLELPYEDNYTTLELLAIPDSSLLLYTKVGNAWSTKASFTFEKYNNRLEKVWSTAVELEPGAEYIRSFQQGNYMYLAFTGKVAKAYTFLEFNLSAGNFQVKQLDLEAIDAIYEFGVLEGQYFVIGRNRKDGNPLMLHVNPAANAVKILPTVYGEESTFSDLLIDTENRRVEVVLTESNKRISRLQVKSFSKAGELISNHFILQQEDKSLLNAEISSGDGPDKLLFGTYGTRDLRFTQGFFVAPVTSGLLDGELFNMMQLKNFLKYLKPRREERVRRREMARVRSGKEPGNRYRLLLHDLIPTPDGYVLPAEVYYPQYRNTASEFSIRSNSSRGFEGYRRTHALVLYFDKNGVLLWDNSFPLKDVISIDLVNTVEVSVTADNRVIMAYPENDKIKYKLMHNDVYNEEELELELMTYKEEEKIQSTDQPGIISWYGNTFAAFGFQRIKAPGIIGEGREVFYINKIVF